MGNPDARRGKSNLASHGKNLKKYDFCQNTVIAN
jgi:hypothetical protein